MWIQRKLAEALERKIGLRRERDKRKRRKPWPVAVVEDYSDRDRIMAADFFNGRIQREADAAAAALQRSFSFVSATDPVMATGPSLDFTPVERPRRSIVWEEEEDGPGWSMGRSL